MPGAIWRNIWRLNQNVSLQLQSSIHNKHPERKVIFEFVANLRKLLVAMEQIDRNHKKKSNPYELPSCFMTPESPADQLGRMTPINFETSPSSVFLTPPCSQEKVCNTQFHSLSLDGLPKLTFELEDCDQERSMKRSLHRSPLLPEDRIIGRLMGTKFVDAISDLMTVNCNTICQRICSYLKPLDLCRYSYVLVTCCGFEFVFVFLRSNVNKPSIICN